MIIELINNPTNMVDRIETLEIHDKDQMMLINYACINMY